MNKTNVEIVYLPKSEWPERILQSFAQANRQQLCGKRLYDADDGQRLNCGKLKGHIGAHYPWPELEPKENG